MDEEGQTKMVSPQPISHLQIRLLGNPLVVRADEPLTHRLSSKALALLAYLVAGPAAAYARDELAGLLWGEIDENRAHYNLRRALWLLRRAINPAHSPHDVYVCFEEGRYCFDFSSDYWLDVTPFEEAVAAASISHLTRPYSNPTPALSSDVEETLVKAVDLYRSDFMAGFQLPDCLAYEDWLLLERDRLRLLYLAALQELVRARMRQRDYAQASAYCGRMLAADPTCETAHRELMLIYNATCERDAALQQYQLLTQTLRRQLDLEPLPETQAVYESIRDGTLPADGLTYSLVQPSRRTGPSSSLPFVGRVEEQASLNQALEAAMRGTSLMVTISGEAGVGKTRLVEECLRRTSVPGLAVLRSRCYVREEALPYQPLIDALRAYLPTLEPGRLARLDDLWLAEVVKLVPELHGYLPHLPLSPALFPEQERNRLFEGLAQFLAHLSQDAPLVFFLDDVHFADQPTLELVHYLGRRLAHTRVMLVIALRQEELGEHPRLRDLLRSLERAGCLNLMRLERLAPEDVGVLVREALPAETDPTGLAHSLYQESRGNSFFVGEMLRVLQEEGNGPAGRLAIPASLREVIQGRLLRLDDDSRQALNAASVIGRQFDSAILRQVYPGAEERLLNALERLIRRHWIEELPGARTGLYDFSHGLVREVVYQLLPSERRRYLHHRVALALEASGDTQGERAGLLARHFWEGGDLARAQRYALLAANHARSLYANREAIGYYRQALDIAASGEVALPTVQYLEVVLALGEVYQLLGEYDAAITVYRQVLPEDRLSAPRVAGTLSDPRRRQLCLQLALACERKGEYPQALTLLGLLEAHMPASSDPDLNLEKAMIAWATARLHMDREQNHQALALCNQALTLLSKLSWSETLASTQLSVYRTMAQSYFHLGNYDIAVLHYERALEIARRLGRRADLPPLLIGLGDVARRRGDYARAEAYARESLSVCQAVGHIAGLGAAHGTLGNVAYNRGHLEAALQHYEQARSIFRQLGDRHGVADYCLSLAFVLFDRGEIEAAEAHLHEAYQIGEALQAELVLIRANYHLAKVAQARGDLELAQARALRAAHMAEGADIEMMKALAYRLLGEILVQQRQLAQAEQHMLESLHALERLGERFEVAWTLRSYARLLWVRAETGAAQALLRQAIAIFSELKAERELERTQQELSRLQSGP
jgi:DNA-binding SARP family transcriptional activator